MTKEVKSQEARNYLTIMKNSEVKTKHKSKDEKLKTIFPFSISSAIDSQLKDYWNTDVDYVHMEVGKMGI